MAFNTVSIKLLTAVNAINVITQNPLGWVRQIATGMLVVSPCVGLNSKGIITEQKLSFLTAVTRALN